MRGIDETDIEIIRLLANNARRPYSEIAERTGVSSPTVSDRVERLQEIGIIRRFTLDLDHSVLEDGVPVLVDIHAYVDTVQNVSRAIENVDRVITVYTTADAHVLFTTMIQVDHVHDLVARTIDQQDFETYELKLLSHTATNPQIEDIELSIRCAHCDNLVTEQGESSRVEGTLYHFCCELCLTQFTERYEKLRE